MTRSERYLAVYSGILTVAFSAVLLTGWVPGTARFDELTVERLNVVEPDGTLRMVISNHDRLPGIIVRGRERPLDRPQAGMVFYNDEASEIGGLIFGGRQNASGNVVDSGASLSFDRYEANQIVQLMGVDDSTDRIAGLIVSDSPSGNEVNRRIWLGRSDDGQATLALLDGSGTKRLVLAVDAAGNPSISVLDDDGKVVRNLLDAR